ncbi:MAG: hypothetical protein H6R18_1437 [Proteobacteria bacterium]|nr:hypothetical protein [Pseudomonadota bacterium]
MSLQRRFELATRRGELTAHIAMQRGTLAGHMQPVARLLGVADRAVDGAHWLKRHPQIIAAFAVGLLIARPRRAWRWAKRAFFVWRSWKALQSQLG